MSCIDDDSSSILHPVPGVVQLVLRTCRETPVLVKLTTEIGVLDTHGSQHVYLSIH